MKTLLTWLLLVVVFAPAASTAVNTGDEVVVVYNTAVRESKSVAEHYARARNVPANQVLGLSLPDRETISRTEYRELLAEPLRREFEKRRWIEFQSERRAVLSNAPPITLQRPVAGRIRYLVLCFGTPLRISADPTLVEPFPLHPRPEMRRNEAAVDSELALLPRDPKATPLSGPFGNLFLGQTNPAVFHPTNGLLMVTRLDGPTPELARGLVDKALQAEHDGLWGRMYFDARSTTDTNYMIGDAWIQGAANTMKRAGYEVVLDTNPGTFATSYPMSQIAIYMGWYDTSVSGPFARPAVEFMPGAFAYHLYSYSATSLRGRDWVPTLIARGATCTVGYTEEPYLQATLNLHAFASLWLRGFTFGEAAYGSCSALSWQTTFIGDPLYQPFGSRAEELHRRLTSQQSPLLEWSILRAINQNILVGDSRSKFVAMLERDGYARQSAVLQEKLAEFYATDGKLIDSADAYVDAWKLSRSPLQKQRIAFAAQRALELLGREAKAIEMLEHLLSDTPDYPDKPAVWTRLVSLYQKSGKPAEAARYQGELDRLAPPPATNAPAAPTTPRP